LHDPKSNVNETEKKTTSKPREFKRYANFNYLRRNDLKFIDPKKIERIKNVILAEKRRMRPSSSVPNLRKST
jgi:hypothetical protein